MEKWNATVNKKSNKNLMVNQNITSLFRQSMSRQRLPLNVGFTGVLLTKTPKDYGGKKV
jgi:hypothetical protein